MLVKEITDVLEEFAPLSLQEDYDNAGLVCGDHLMDVTSVLLSIDVTESVVDEAIANGNELIISHHPLFLKPLKNILPDTYINRCLRKAIKNDLSIYAAHTNMDAVFNGVSGKMADKLELINRSFLQTSERQAERQVTSGFGIVGELKNDVNSVEYLQRIKDIFHCKVLRHTPIHKSSVKKIAVCGGSGAFLVQQAMRAHADIFISGDFKYHDFFHTENQIIIADIGHYESEQYTKEIFFDILTKKIPGLAVRFSTVSTNPVNYI
ncbi:GTP cyclohydrolase 1 type 2 [Bacteroidia bacterium]|nr:GTP cyclohydrolase 1 type 2 [Bacteroidia bacterium]